MIGIPAKLRACPSPSLHFCGENNLPLASCCSILSLLSARRISFSPLDSCPPHLRPHFSYISFESISAPYRNFDHPLLCCVAFSAVLGPSFSCSFFLISLAPVLLLAEVLLPLYLVTVAVAVAVAVFVL